jgi:hypothetical protein
MGLRTRISTRPGGRLRWPTGFDFGGVWRRYTARPMRRIAQRAVPCQTTRQKQTKWLILKEICFSRLWIVNLYREYRYDQAGRQLCAGCHNDQDSPPARNQGRIGQLVNSYRNITVILCCLCCRWGRSHAVLVTGGKEFWLPNVGHQIEATMIEVIRDHLR